MRLLVEMEANIRNRGSSKIKDGRMIWHLFTDMDNQFVRMFDVFPPARVVEKAENNMVAIIKVPELSPGENFQPTAILRMDTTTRDWLMEPQKTPKTIVRRTCGQFCSMKQYWETQSRVIQELSETIAERSNNDITYAKIAFQVVQEQVKLKTHLDERLGAALAAKRKEGDCDEHADLFIALTRAVKIPSRRVVGHYYRGPHEPEPHAWAEVFLENIGWIPIDPALGRFGTLNENYFSRIREGLVSERPTLQLKWSRSSTERPLIEESVKMSEYSNGQD